jgi:hypothetical protein
MLTMIYLYILYNGQVVDRDHIVVGFTTTYALTGIVSSNTAHGEVYSK